MMPYNSISYVSACIWDMYTAIRQLYGSIGALVSVMGTKEDTALSPSPSSRTYFHVLAILSGHSYALLQLISPNKKKKQIKKPNARGQK